jgi:hypothetical protein
MLSNAEREKLVLDLYYNQRKNVRQIAQEARISFRDISAIIKKEAAVNDDGSGNGNENGIVNKEQNKIATTINLPMKKPPKLTNSLAKIRSL